MVICSGLASVPDIAQMHRTFREAPGQCHQALPRPDGEAQERRELTALPSVISPGSVKSSRRSGRAAYFRVVETIDGIVLTIGHRDARVEFDTSGAGRVLRTR